MSVFEDHVSASREALDRSQDVRLIEALRPDQHLLELHPVRPALWRLLKQFDNPTLATSETSAHCLFVLPGAATICARTSNTRTPQGSRSCRWPCSDSTAETAFRSVGAEEQSGRRFARQASSPWSVSCWAFIFVLLSTRSPRLSSGGPHHQ